MEAVSSSETSVNFYHTTRHYIPNDATVKYKNDYAKAVIGCIRYVLAQMLYKMNLLKHTIMLLYLRVS
jgi:hypothetical protein